MKKIILFLLLIPIFLLVNINVYADSNLILCKKEFEEIQKNYGIINNIGVTTIEFEFDNISNIKDDNDAFLIDITSNIPILYKDAKKLEYIMDIEYEYKSVTNEIIIGKDAYDLSIINYRIYEGDDLDIVYYDGRIKMVFKMPIDNVKITQMNYYSLSNQSIKLDENYAYLIDEYIYELIGITSEYLTPYDDIKPVITIDSDIYTSIDSPILPSAIKLMATANDNILGDITNRIFISDTNYSGKEIGDFYIVLTVIDDYENRYDKLVNIHVKDVTPPSISGNNYYEVGIIKGTDVLDIYKSLDIYDNVSLNLKVIIDDDYTVNKDKVGEYRVIYRVFDEANNESRFEIKIKVNDDVKPFIVGNDINTYISNPISINDILNTFSYTDNITTNENLISTYDTNYDYRNVGSYYLKLMVADEVGNIGERIISINVIDDEKPFFIVDEKVVKNPLSHEELLKYFNIN